MSQSSNGSSAATASPPRSGATVTATHVTFHSSEGAAMRGTLARVTRHAVFFELLGSDYAPLVSEALARFEIVFHDTIIYSGRAVVRNIVNTGLAVTCEATLDESQWNDVNPLLAVRQNGGLVKEFKTFMNEWQNFYKLLPEYKIVIADMHTFLADARLWLEQAEVGVRHLPAEAQLESQRGFARQLEPMVVTAIQSLFEKFEEVAAQVDADVVEAHNAFGRRLVQPLLMGSPFVHRTLTKPLGYAGDYEMVNMMFRDPFQGPSLFAKMVNLYALQLPPIVAHRNRIDYLTGKIERETLRVVMEKRTARIFNLGCGPAQEIQRFIAGQETSSRAHFTLLDFNDETLAYTSRLLGDLKQRHGRRTGIQTIKKSVHMLIKAASRREDYLRPGQYDLVYCAGLFDYLNDVVCRQLMDIFYELVAPGGLLVATNVDDHPAKGQMECFLEWNLIYRNNEKMLSVKPQKAGEQEVVIKRDPSGVNLFLEVRKPGREE
jgi:extracellular factor (EF) 3-hydroxypalmitic acid methyl ester biosynthesis protein